MSDIKPAYRPAMLGACLAIGVILGVIGTALHGNIWVFGEPGTLRVLPWGAALALALLLGGVLWAGTTAGSFAEPLLMGAAAFTVATAAYLWPGADQLMVHPTAIAWSILPGPVLASLIWWFGSAAVTVLGMFLVRAALVRDARFRHEQAHATAAEVAPWAPPVDR